MIDYSSNSLGDVVFDSVAVKGVELRISLSEFIRIANETKTEAEFRVAVIRQARLKKYGEIIVERERKKGE